MSATKTGEGNAIVTSDLLSDIMEEAPEVKAKTPRKERTPFTADAAVVESCRKAFANVGGFTVPRAFATLADARKATNLLLRHAILAGETFADEKGKPKTATRTIVNFTDAYRAAHAWAASATNDQFRVSFRLTFTKTPKTDEEKAAAKVKREAAKAAKVAAAK